LQAAQRSPEGVQLRFIGIFLALREFEGLKHLFHFLQAFAQGFNDPVHLLDRILNGLRRSLPAVGPWFPGFSIWDDGLRFEFGRGVIGSHSIGWWLAG
jgi:hypothetical protein